MHKISATDPSTRTRVGIRPVRYTLADLAMMCALAGVAINGTTSIFASLPTYRDPRHSGGVHQRGLGVPSATGQSDEEPSIAVANVGRFTPYWFRPFAAAIAIGVVAIPLSFFVTAQLLRSDNERAARLIPRFAAATTCLLFVTLLSSAACLINQHTYEAVWELKANKTALAGLRAVGAVLALGLAIVGVEYISGARSLLTSFRLNSRGLNDQQKKQFDDLQKPFEA